jgi:hypothetical protein
MLDMTLEADRKLLMDNITADYQSLEHYRKLRNELVKAYVPKEYNREGDTEDTIVPTLYQLVETDVNTAVMQNPRVTVETDLTLLKPAARAEGLAINRRLTEIDFARTFREVVIDDEFMMGIAEVSNGEPHVLNFGEGGRYNVGKPTVKRIPFDDFVYDQTAKRWSEIRYCAAFFQADLELLKRQKQIDWDSVETLQTGQITRDGMALTESISKGEGATRELLSKRVECVKAWLPQDGGKVVTMVKGRPDLAPLKVQKWTGHYCGPFIIGQGSVPDQIMPLSPALVVLRIHRLINRLWCKSEEQAAQQRNVTAFQGGAQDDARRLMDSVNGSVIHVSMLDKIKMFSTMGPDQVIRQMAMEAQGLFDRSANNLPLRAGLAPSADTVGQEQMLFGASSQLDAKKNNRIVGLAAKIIIALRSLMRRNKFYTPTNHYQQGPLTVAYPYEDREGKEEDFRPEIEPYSMMYQNPSAKFQALMNYLQQRMMLMQAGPDAFNLGEVDEIAAEYLGLPRLRDICGVGSQLAPDNFPSEGMPKPGKPNGNYRRTGGGEAYADKMLQASMMSGKTQGNTLPTGISDV